MRYNHEMVFETAQLMLLGLATVLVPGIRNRFVPPAITVQTEGSGTVRGRLEFFDVIKGVAICAVVLIHVTYFLLDTQVSGVVNDYVNNLLRFALPIFFICSGILLPVPQLTVGWLKKFYGRRFIAIGFPYLLFSIPYGVALGLTSSELLSKTLTGSIEVPFYFVAVMFQLYLLYPIIYRYALKRWFVWVTLGFSFISFATPALRAQGDLMLFTAFLFFFVWGVYMRPYILEKKIEQVWWPWLLLVVLYLGAQPMIGIERFYNTQFFYGIAVFMLLYLLHERGYFLRSFGRFFTYIGERSLWIFLTHFMLMSFVFEKIFTENGSQSLFATTAFTVVSLFSSIVVGVIAERIYTYCLKVLQLI